MRHYTLMLATQAEFIKDYPSLDEAITAGEELLASDSTLLGEVIVCIHDGDGVDAHVTIVQR